MVAGRDCGGLEDIEQEIVVRLRYAVRFTTGLFEPDNPLLRQTLRAGDRSRARALVVVDAGLVARRPSLLAGVHAYCLAHDDVIELAADPLVVTGGEVAKNGSGAVRLVRDAINRHAIDRHAYVVAVGGGAVLDAVGYAAATAHRGVRLVRVPTTTLAQNDSAVGVKNGVNAYGQKNFIGTFAAPFAVLNDLELLTTLSDRDWRSGIAEAIKVALLKDAAFFEWIEQKADVLRERSLSAMARLVHRCAALHLEHIATSGDPFELGSGRPLDFGHWAAHKLERLTDFALRHGEAVAIGLALDVTYARLSGWLDAAACERVVTVLERAGLPVWHPALLNDGRDGRAAVLDGLEEFRRHLGGRLTITQIGGIGCAFEVDEIDEDLVLDAVRALGRRSTSSQGAGWEPMQAPAR